MSSDYYENLEGSPYINEAAMDYINKLKNAGSNFLNKFKGSKPYSQNNPNPKPTQELSNTDKDFIKIVEKVSEILIKKINSDLKNNHKSEWAEKHPEQSEKTPSDTLGNINKLVTTSAPHYNKLKSKEAEIEADRDRLMGNSFNESVEDNSTEDVSDSGTKLHVANTEEKAGGWLNWFRGQYRKSIKFGLDLNLEDKVTMSNGTDKVLKLKWSNINHKNKIIVNWTTIDKGEILKKYQEKPDKFKFPSNKWDDENGKNPYTIDEEVNDTPVKNSGEFVIFEFYDDQINPKSPSYQEPSIELLLTQANRYSKVIDKIKTSPELQKLSVPVFECLYSVIEQKWTEFKGHKVNPEDIKFKMTNNGYVEYTGIDGESNTMSPHIINSILLGGEESTSADFKNTGLGFQDFIEKLKKSGFREEYLTGDDAKKIFNGQEISNVNLTPNIQDAITALTTIGWSKDKAEKTISGIVSMFGDTKATEFYTHKALNPNAKVEYEPKPNISQQTSSKENKPEDLSNKTPEVEIEGNKIKYGDKTYKIGSFLPPKLLSIIKNNPELYKKYTTKNNIKEQYSLRNILNK
jgi:hypothetical protein